MLKGSRKERQQAAKLLSWTVDRACSSSKACCSCLQFYDPCETAAPVFQQNLHGFNQDPVSVLRAISPSNTSGSGGPTASPQVRRLPCVPTRLLPSSHTLAYITVLCTPVGAPSHKPEQPQRTVSCPGPSPAFWPAKQLAPPRDRWPEFPVTALHTGWHSNPFQSFFTLTSCTDPFFCMDSNLYKIEIMAALSLQAPGAHQLPQFMKPPIGAPGRQVQMQAVARSLFAGSEAQQQQLQQQQLHQQQQLQQNHPQQEQLNLQDVLPAASVSIPSTSLPSLSSGGAAPT